MEKFFIFLGMFIGSTVGSYVPALWGGSAFSGASILLGTAGAILGLWGGWVLGQRFGD